MGGALFWTVAALVAAASLGLALAPLWRGTRRGDRRASYDVEVLRHQLREVDADLARGILAPAEAAASRTELSRRLIAAADAEAAEAASSAAPRGLSRRVAAGTAVLGLAASLGLYALFGAPGMPDAPQAERIAAARADRPSQAAAEAANGIAPPAAPPEETALIDRLRAVLADRPADLEGHRLLARSLAALQRWPEARAAQAEVVRIAGADATAQDQVDLAQLGIMAAGGYVSPESERALAAALSLDPRHQVGRYYSGLALMQAGRPDLAYDVFAALTAEGPPDAPWAGAARELLDEAALRSGRTAPEERQAMIEGMVAGLADRLATDGGPPADWARLIRSLAVLGRRDEAAAIAAEARAAYPGDPAGRAEIDAAAREAGLP